MDKSILQQYQDAELLIERTERQIQRLRAAKEQKLSDTVRGSNPNFPYEPRTFRIEGFGSLAYNDEQISYLERLLTERRTTAAKLRLETEAWINTLPPRMQLVVQMKYLNGATWEEVARKVGRGTSPDGIRMEWQRYIGGLPDA